MNKKREPYDKIAVGERIRHKRMQLGLSQDELAVRINRATKYCSDIERVYVEEVPVAAINSLRRRIA